MKHVNIHRSFTGIDDLLSYLKIKKRLDNLELLIISDFIKDQSNPSLLHNILTYRFDIIKNSLLKIFT